MSFVVERLVRVPLGRAKRAVGIRQRPQAEQRGAERHHRPRSARLKRIRAQARVERRARIAAQQCERGERGQGGHVVRREPARAFVARARIVERQAIDVGEPVILPRPTERGPGNGIVGRDLRSLAKARQRAFEPPGRHARPAIRKPQVLAFGSKRGGAVERTQRANAWFDTLVFEEGLRGSREGIRFVGAVRSTRGRGDDQG